ncbi:hypothetical protein QR680_003429 [Steinernema hermaphroditum]|uniref:Winged helix Storkhead-box1 domain-containing protein n=1 Tax=Steinernema hermaphroditum TaxID=289476 RepID=A0AA39LKB8_9BILA|nr:hypothetical protein QR680_003429 [Steinernema hermaphroditum]
MHVLRNLLSKTNITRTVRISCKRTHHQSLQDMTLNISSKCLAIVFETAEPNRRHRNSKNGHKMFASFVEENKLSFWNRDLVAAVGELEYVGFLRPSTLFVSCQTSQHLAILRASWARRILKPASGFSIVSFGDMGGIQIDRVEQAQFVPLADVICDVIAQLNRLGQVASSETLATEIRLRFAGVAPPTNDMIAHTLNSLIRTGLVYQMGKHLFVSVPAATVTQDKPSYPYHVVPPVAPQSCTVECQTGKSIINGELYVEKVEQTGAAGNEVKTKASKRGILARLFARKENTTSPGKPKKIDANGKGPVTFTAQFPPASWISSNNENNNIPPFGDIKSKKFYTVPENLCKEEDTYDDGTTEAETYMNLCKVPARRTEHRRNKEKRRSRRYYMSGSSECLNYGPIDPPECLPSYEAESIEQIRPERISTKQRRRTTHIPSSRVPIRTSTPIHAEVPACRRGAGSDSAYSASPVMPDDDESTTFFAKTSTSSWSDRIVSQTSSDGIHEDSECNQHTYVNLGPSFDSTQFEEITQIESACGKQPAVAEHRADTRNIFPVNL